MFAKRTDLALEARELWQESAENTTKLSGVKAIKTRREGYPVTRVQILDDNGAKSLSKPVGDYLTVDLSTFWQRKPDYFERAVRAIGAELKAMTIGSDKEALVELGSLLASRMSEGELHFVIGHELGHIAMGHVVYHSVLNAVHTMTDLLPLVGNAIYQMINYPLQGWFRRSELTADRAGLLCCRDLETAQRALLQVSAGFLDAGAVKIDDYIRDSREQVGRSALSRLGELKWNHPITTRRLEALGLFASSEKYYRLACLPVPEGEALLSDEELERQTERIVQVIGA